MIATIVNPRLTDLTVSCGRGSIDFALEDSEGGRVHLRFGPGGACAAFFVECFDAVEERLGREKGEDAEKA